LYLFHQELARAGVREFVRVLAADGREFRGDAGDAELAWLFRRNHFRSDSSVMGCALSHLRIWMKLVQCQHTREQARPAEVVGGGAGDGGGGGEGGRGRGGMEWVLVLEDDVELREGFAGLMRGRLASLESAGRDWDFICVGSRQALDEFVDFDAGHEVPET
jgi:hypothetical protein